MDESLPAGAANHLGDIGQIARILSQDLAAVIRETITAELHAQPNRQVLTGPEAAAYCRLSTYRSFSSWRRRFHVPACGHCRFARVKLDMGLERESRQIRARF